MALLRSVGPPPVYEVVWNGRGDRPYLSCEPEVPLQGEAIAPRKYLPRGAGLPVLDALRNLGTVATINELAELTGLAREKCRTTVRKAAERGLVECCGLRKEAKHAYAQTYRWKGQEGPTHDGHQRPTD